MSAVRRTFLRRRFSRGEKGIAAQTTLVSQVLVTAPLSALDGKGINQLERPEKAGDGSSPAPDFIQAPHGRFRAFAFILKLNLLEAGFLGRRDQFVRRRQVGERSALQKLPHQGFLLLSCKRALSAKTVRECHPAAGLEHAECFGKKLAFV